MWNLVSLLLGAIIIPSAVRGIQTKNTVWPIYKTFYSIKNNKIEFEVKSNGHDAWIALFKEPYPSAPKYEILLRSYGDTVVEILRDRTITLGKLKAQVLDYYNYRSFLINLEKNISSEDLKLSVFRSGEAIPFISVNDHQPIDVNYFSLATTGAGNNGYWKVKGIDEASVIQVDSNFTTVTTEANVGFPIYKKYFTMTGNAVRLKVKAPNIAWIRFTPKRTPFPNYEISFDANYNHKISIYKSGKKVVKYFYNSVLDKDQYISFWIKFSEFIDSRGSKGNNICIGHENELIGFLIYDDNSPSHGVNYFSIATTIDIQGVVGTWKLEI